MRRDPGNPEVIGLRADNPGPLTLDGTNSWIVGTGSAGAWVIDPGPALEAHQEAIAAEVKGRSGLAGIALTHGHGDHVDGVPLLLGLLGPAPVVGPRPHGEGAPAHEAKHGPLAVHALPGHTADHVAYVHESGIAFTGDAIFAESSVFVSPGPGSLAGYLGSLEELAQLRLDALAPGHGPVIDDPAGRIRDQIDHRLERERRLIDSLAEGHRSVDGILAVVWDDVPPQLKPAAAVTLAAHLDKLEEEGRLPEGVERPETPDWVV